MAGKVDYTDTRHLLFRGFLTCAAEVSSVPIVFKTLNQTEYEQLLLYSASSDPEEASRLQTSYFLAYSIYLFNRTSILADREEYLPALVDVIHQWPESLRYRILNRLNRLNSRASDALHKVQAFSYGVESRQQWSAYKNLSLNDPKVTGVAGTEALSINLHQKLWFFFNKTDDVEEDYNRLWSQIKFLASFHNPKEVKRLNQQDLDRLKDKEARRIAIYNGRDPYANITRTGEIKVSNESVEDLLGELHRSMQGQKDFHDLVIEEHERKLREKFLEEKRAREEARLEAQERNAALLETAGQGQPAFYDSQAIDAIVAQQRARKTQARERGEYASPAAFKERETRLAKYGMLGGDVAGDQEEPFIRGNLWEDYYEKTSPSIPSNDIDPTNKGQ